MNAVDTIVEKAATSTVDAIAHQVGYLIDYKSNREDLKTKVGELSNARERLQQLVDDAVGRDETIYKDVESWLDNVARIIEEANMFLANENQAKVKCGFCPNPIMRHKLSRKSTKLAQSVVELYEKRDFPNGVSYRVRPEEVLKTSAEEYQVLDSRSKIVEKIMEKLGGLDTNMIGVYGFGGVGKTTLVEEVYRQAIKDKLFNDVVIVRDVKKNPDLVNIQKQIAEKLGLDVPKNETQQGRVGRISLRIKDKKTLVILDDVRENIELEDVGIPKAAKCKILFTSRRKMVFRDYRQEDFRLDALDEPETWKLFEKKAGVVVQDPSVRNEAEDAAKKCRGLPVSVRRVASSINNRSNQEALKHLKSLGNEDYTETEYSIIKWSYDQLDIDDLKKLFVLCAITARGNLIYLQDVFKYSMGLGLFKNLNIRKAQKYFDSLVHKLLDFCLLTSDYFIHDLVRDAAFRIATEDPYILFRTNGDEEFEEWQNKDLFQRSTMIIFLNCHIPKLPEVLECPELKFFQLCSNDKSLEIPLKFFSSMKELKVLNQTNLKVPSLPQSLQYLTSLQSLCLHRCVLENIALVGELKTLEVLSFEDSEFTHLPEEIGKLSHLRMLDLNYCSKLEVIFPNVISSLTRLEELRMMKCSFNQWEAEIKMLKKKPSEDEIKAASLSELKNLSKLTSLAIHIPNANMLPADLFSNMCLDRYQILIGDEWEWDRSFNNRVNRLLKLKLTTSMQLEPSLETLLRRSESLYLDTFEEGFDELFDREDVQKVEYLHVQNNAYIFNEEDEFPNLQSLTVHGYNGLSFLLSSSTARSLERLNYLEISECECMEEIIWTDETSEISEENPNNMFCKLEYLELDNLPNLTRFCCSGSYIEFPCVERMKINKCAKLEKFIFDSSCRHVAHDEESIGERDSKESLETVSQYYLFDEKVRFPRLEILSIEDLPPKFTTLWHPQIDQHSFCKLKSVIVQGCPSLTNIFVPSIMGRLNALSALDISDCESLQRIFEVEGSNVKEIRDTTHQLETLYCQALHSVVIKMCKSLKNVFPVSVAKGLQLLQKLTVERCEVLEEIVAKDEGLETVPKFVFPKVTSLTFQNLPQLRSFFPGSHASMWPLLKTFNIQKCDQVDIFAAESSSFLRGRDTAIKQPFFLIEKGSFSKLKKLTLGPMDLWYGQHGPAEFFRKLKSIEFCGYEDETKKPGFLPICQNTYWTFTRVKRLELIGMSKQHLWKEECQPIAVAESSVFPNLENLVVNRCDALVSLTLSTISFQNLNSLEVTECWDMKYLATYSMAKSLVHLRKLNVTDCVSLIKIIAASDGDEDDAGNYEITFSKLKHLELCNLTSLQHFGLGKCIVPLKPVPKVTNCPIGLNVSSDGVLEKVDLEWENEWRELVYARGQLVPSILRASSDLLRPFLRYYLCFSRNLFKTGLRLSQIMNQSSQTLLICIFVILVAFFYFFLFRS